MDTATSYFTGKRDTYQAQLTTAQETAQTAAAKVAYAGQALALLEKANPTQGDLHTIVDLYVKAG
jgi:hypothetical protein